MFDKLFAFMCGNLLLETVYGWNKNGATAQWNGENNPSSHSVIGKVASICTYDGIARACVAICSILHVRLPMAVVHFDCHAKGHWYTQESA
eukprot:3413064-Ditylum_brightwellii.AAC.2